MAMKAMRCPQCGADLGLDDAKDFGFCSSCGTKVMLREEVEMKHTGYVNMKVDNSDQGRNRLMLGHRAFEGKNYQEAYNYYTQGLEDVPDDFTALYRKGICAVLLSPKDNLRLSELSSALTAARGVAADGEAKGEEGTETEPANNQLRAQFDADMENLCVQTLAETQQYYYQLANAEKGNHQAAIWCEAAKLVNVATGAIFDHGLAEGLLEASIRRCDEWLGYDKRGMISYYTNTTADKKGRTKDHYTTYRMSDARRQIIEAARSEMAQRYNSLPARLQHEQNLSNALSTLQEESDALKSKLNEAESQYNAAKEGFWSRNPELTARKDKNKMLSWISVGVGAVLLVVSILLRSALGFLPILGLGIFAVSFYVRNEVANRSLAKLERQVFPSDVQELREQLNHARKEWVDKETARRNQQSEISAFESKKM